MPTKSPSGPISASQPKRTAASTATLTGASPMMRAAHGFGLGQEQVERGHRDDADGEALFLEEALAPQARSRPPSRRRRSSRAPCLRPARARRRPSPSRLPSPASRADLRQVLAGQGEHASARRVRSSASCQHSAVSTASAGRNTRMLRHGAQRREMLDRLVGRAVLAEADGIVRHHVDDRDAGERRDAHGGAGIVGEDQEGGAGRHAAAMQRDAVHGRRHAVLADAVMDVAAAEGARARWRRGSWSWCCSTASGRPSRAPAPASPRSMHLERDLARLAGRDGLRLGDEARLQLRHGLREARRADRPRCGARTRRASPPGSACDAARSQARRSAGRCVPALTQAGRIAVRARRRADGPSRAPPSRRRAPRRRAARRGPSRCRPSSARRSRWWSCRRSASAGRTSARRASARAIASGSWPSTRSARQPQASKRLTWSTRVGQRQRPVDRDAVVVEEHDEAVELQVPGERDRLLADPLHQVAVGGEHVGAVVDELVAELGVQHALGERHADRGARGPGRAGPVVVSTPGVMKFSGWPGRLRTRAGGSASARRPSCPSRP